MTGTFSIPNSVFEDVFFEEKRSLSRREALAWIAKHVRWTDNCVLKRGQGRWSERYLAEAWGWAKSRVRRFLLKLESMNLLRLESGPGRGPVEKIITYLFSTPYSDTKAETGPAADQQRTSSGPKTNTGNSGKESWSEQAAQASPASEGSGTIYDGEFPDLTADAAGPSQVPPETEHPAKRQGAGPSPNSAAPPSRKPRERKQKRMVPGDWHPRQDTIEKMRGELGVTDAQIEVERLKFIDNSSATGKTYVELDSGFRNWLRNAKGWGHLDARPKFKTKQEEYSL